MQENLLIGSLNIKYKKASTFLSKIDSDWERLIKKERPTIIFPTRQQLPGIKLLSRAIQRTNLYERVAIVSYSPDVYYKSINGDIYRLKSFRNDSN